MLLTQLVQSHTYRWRWALIVSSLFLCLAAFFSLAAGELWIWPFAPQSPLESQFLSELRMPRTIAAILIGASLAVSGAVLQVLLGNPLAEPGVLGISGGASVALVVMTFWFPELAGTESKTIAAMMGALAFTALLVFMARKRVVSTTRLLLVGVALGILSGAIVTWAFYFSNDLSLRQLMYWLMGSLSGVQWSQLILALVMLPAVVFLCCQGRKLDLLMLGDVQARQLGLESDRLRWQLILLVSLLVGGAVAMAGVIGFVGLVVPHLLRMVLGTENRFLLPLSAVCGACLLLFADTFSRLAASGMELPVGVVTTSIGTPIFIWMLMKRP
ncbi:vitamin B12 ABC transporter permease BtuC [Veronia nyctiphanis]|uniref:Vitamin B12 ABC transporter permease BtuC n=1 Tax=Veronia nyctiphanis TaxID=1278244 RepID=A0A4Q0YUB7_9GAMM|nr:vitamin B12 ABC transporter permease BtuC [Veronia nyctiphanis]RXJ74363.1 vitamin B12 ABC transporter permease BtuC [Veronia nyctiphanis]